MDVSDQWREFSQSEREREYSPSSCVGGDISAFLEAYETRSQQARDHLVGAGREIIQVRYGPAASQTVDLVTPPSTGESTPLLVFIHGGYWQQLSKRESFFNATDCIAHNLAFAAVDYTLAPDASLDEIVAECRAAMQALLDVADQHQIDTERIIVAGSSAGAHLSAMVGLGIESTWRPTAVALISGVFDLEPLIGTSINDAVQLDSQAALRNSPLFEDLTDFPRSLIAYGSNETNEFKRQSADFASRAAAAGTPVTLRQIDERNHFDIILDLCDASTELGQLTLGLVPAG